MLCETEKFTNVWPRRPQQTSKCHLTLGSKDTHTASTLAKFSVKLLQFSLVETAQYVRQCSWCCMQGISLLIIPATIWSPIYPNLRMCLVRDSGLFTLLTQTLIWSYSVAVLSQLYLAWIQDKELHIHTHTHTHKLLSNILTVFCSSSAIQPAWPFCAGSCPTNDMAAALSAATYSSSRFSCNMFWSAFVTKDCKQSQSSFELMWKQSSP